ncbi:hypothetical protein LGQ02_04915 [Bacillus shivajii]|uniref:hypothetical protein n=1 Tax=Bacillus shivajii TaxID=1983719 RepID=UPI001CF98A7A|nr:hypothetical protein [Bacillus shivajii]UCZ54124.1 hypothetical protein LGQ02_04915 [Bacillus shivajii]
MTTSKVFIMALLLSFIYSCSHGEKTSYDLEGRIIGSPNNFNMLTVLVEDNFGGSYVKNDVNRHQIERYIAEAYRIHIRPDTMFFVDEKGVTNEQGIASLDSLNQKVSVKVAGEFKREKTPLQRYIRYDQSFSPIYEAKKIKVHPYQVDDIVYAYLPVNENDYVLLSFYSYEKKDYNQLNKFTNLLNQFK